MEKQRRKILDFHACILRLVNKGIYRHFGILVVYFPVLCTTCHTHAVESPIKLLNAARDHVRKNFFALVIRREVLSVRVDFQRRIEKRLCDVSRTSYRTLKGSRLAITKSSIQGVDAP